MTGPDIRIEYITPERAEYYLSKNTHNRNLRKTVVATYAADMKAGNWEWNGEGIKFQGDHEVLIDGQHRLAAIVESGVTIKMLVISNLTGDTQHTMDTGAKRTFGDALKLRGESSYVSLAAIVRGAYLWQSGSRSLKGGAGIPVTNTILLNFLEGNPWLRDAVNPLSRARVGSGMTMVIGGAMYYAFMQIDPEDCDHFFARLASDEGHYKGEPIYMLRKYLHTMREEKRLYSNAKAVSAVTIKAWNAYREGREIGHLSFRAGGATPEEFPEPR